MSLLARLGGASAMPASGRASGGPGFTVRRWRWGHDEPLSLAGAELPAFVGEVALRGGLERLVGSGGPVSFLDTETTGLGSGSVPFMIGMARIDSESRGRVLTVEQWCLERLSAEPAMLTEVARRLEGAESRVVTFNGASFDLPLLEGRARRWRVAASVFSDARRHQLDLVHPARRLGRERLEDCRLQTLERSWLGLERAGDIPGEVIPELFHEALAEGAPGLPSLDPVRIHNALDLCSLAWLLAELGHRLERASDLDEALRGARLLADRGAEAQALSLLEPWVNRGLRGSGRARAPAQLRDAGLLVARLHRRAGRHDRAGALWTRLAERFVGDPRVHEALAKYLEHRRGDLEGALAATRASRMPDPDREARLVKRLGREPEPEAPEAEANPAPVVAGPAPLPRPRAGSRPSVFRRRLPGL